MATVPFWIAELLVSERTYRKVSGRHNLRVEDIRDAVLCRRGLRGSYEQTKSGPRLYVTVRVDSRRVLVVLAPHDYDVDVYYLASAYPA